MGLFLQETWEHLSHTASWSLSCDEMKHLWFSKPKEPKPSVSRTFQSCVRGLQEICAIRQHLQPPDSHCSHHGAEEAERTAVTFPLLVQGWKALCGGRKTQGISHGHPSFSKIQIFQEEENKLKSPVGSNWSGDDKGNANVWLHVEVRALHSALVQKSHQQKYQKCGNKSRRKLRLKIKFI